MRVFLSEIILFLVFTLRPSKLQKSKIKRAKIDQFEKTQGDLESSFHGLFDGKVKFEKFSLVKNLFKKNCRKKS